MATREQNCKFGVEEEGAEPCGECRRCCDYWKVKAIMFELQYEIIKNLSRRIRVGTAAIAHTEFHRDDLYERLQMENSRRPNAKKAPL